MVGAIQLCAELMTSKLEKYADKKEDFEAKRYNVSYIKIFFFFFF